MGTAPSKFGQTTIADHAHTTAARANHGPCTCIHKSKVNQYYSEISAAINPNQLLPLLLKEDLLDFSEKSALLGDSKTTYEKSCYILQSLEAKGPTAYYKFLSCVVAETHHMGHEYIASLLQGRAFGSKFELELSSRLSKAIQRYTPEMMDISLHSLVPLLSSNHLLTIEEEQKLLSCHKTEHEKVLLLLQLLNTKGPLAHGLFVECLRSKLSHPTHNELYTLLMKSYRDERRNDPGKKECTVDDCALVAAIPRTKLFRRWELQGPLKGKKYNEMMREFESCNHNGDWKRLEIEAAKYARCSIPEYEAVAGLERALSWIFRRKPETVVQLVDEAKKIIKTRIQGENQSILLGRSEYILSIHFRYLKNSKRAKEHVGNAKELLYGIECGEDSALVHFCDACIKVECLDQQSTESDFERVDRIFGRAICDDRSHTSGVGLVAPSSLVRLAQMYLGGTYYSAGRVTSRVYIEQARKCLDAIILLSPSKRIQCLYHITESDLHRNCGRIDEAKKSLELALSISRKCKFELEISSVQTRLQSLISS